MIHLFILSLKEKDQINLNQKLCRIHCLIESNKNTKDQPQNIYSSSTKH
jgi:hypothetical protein